MGTSSGGSSGSGSGLSGGGGGGGGYGGGGGGGGGSSGSRTYTSRRGIMIPEQPSESDTDKKVGGKFKELFSRAATYTNESFSNKHIQQVYRELFVLADLLRGSDNVDRIGQRYHLNMTDTGFYFTLIDAILNRFSTAGIDARCINTTRTLLDRFLQLALGKKLELIATGTGKDIVKAMSENVEFWQHRSGHFLSQLAYAIYLKEIERPNAVFSIQQSVEKRTNAVISNYVERAKSEKGKIDYSGLMEYISDNWEWFKSEVTK
jgi:hypothetical protein